MTNREIIFGLVGAAFVSGLILFSVWYDNRQQGKINAHGGIVGVVNRSDHRLTLSLFGHNNAGVTIHSNTLEPNTEWIILDSLSKIEVTDFPSDGDIDSALLIFDDSVPIWHKGQYPWDVKYEDHFIHNDVHWVYDPLIVRHAFRGHKAIYRPARVYTITNNDFNRTIIKTE